MADFLKNKWVREGLRALIVGLGVVYINPFILGLVNNLTIIPQTLIYGVSFPHGFISLGVTAYGLIMISDYLLGKNM